jgi:hypothetical protein
VKVTTSLLADAAIIADGKLYVHGGGWDSISGASLPLTYPSFALVLVMELDVTELTGAQLLITLVDDVDTQMLSVTGHLETDGVKKFPNRKSINMPLAVTFPGVIFTRAGNHAFKVVVDGGEIHSLNFTVIVP